MPKIGLSPWSTWIVDVVSINTFGNWREIRSAKCNDATLGSRHMLDRLHIPAVEAHHAPSQKVAYENMKESVAWVRVRPTKQAFREGIDDI